MKHLPKLKAPMPKYHFGTVVANLMLDRNLNQSELATKAGVDRNTVGNLLKGITPSVETQEKIAGALDVTRDLVQAEVERLNSSTNVIPIRSGHDRDYDVDPVLGEAMQYARRIVSLPRLARMTIYQLVATLEDAYEKRSSSTM